MNKATTETITATVHSSGDPEVGIPTVTTEVDTLLFAEDMDEETREEIRAKLKDLYDEITQDNCFVVFSDEREDMPPLDEEPERLSVKIYDTLSFAELRHANIVRGEEWAVPNDSATFRGLELGGEIGELLIELLPLLLSLNTIKKLARGSAVGSIDIQQALAQLENELADGIICIDRVADKFEIDLGACTRKKFNATSDKHGLATKL